MLRYLAGLAAVVVVVGACGDDPVGTTPLSSDGTHLRDDRGRIALLRGVNARVEGVFDVTFSDGRTALEPIPALTAADCTRMHELGFDFLRLPINWSGVEPARDQFDEAYLARVDAAVRCAEAAGILVMIDLHQDAYSKEIGEDGAPLWAIDPAPAMLLEGPLTDLDTRRLSPQVNDAFATLFAGGDIADQFAEMAAYVAARWADDPAVIGFEVLNEPVGSDDAIASFTEAVAARIRTAAPHKLVMFEPNSSRNLFDNARHSPVPFPTDSAVYAPHVYTFVFSNAQGLANLRAEDLEYSVAGARDEATAWRTPLMIGEFGVGPTTTNADLWMGLSAQMHDRYLASDAFWLWKEDSQGSWGVFDKTGDAWTERAQVTGWISRLHASRIAGTVDENEFDPVARTLRLTVHGAGSTPHVIYVPSASATATCDGATVAISAGFVDVVCDGTLMIRPQGAQGVQ